MTKEALKLALEALESKYIVNCGAWRVQQDQAIAAIKKALAQPEPKCVAVVEVFGKDWRLDFMSLPVGKHKLYAQQYTYTAPTQQKPFGWKLVPIEPTNEMLKAMDECSTEGYDERLLAGHAASVYMAAVDVAPTPPQRQEPEHEPVAWMYPDEYERMTTSETFCTVYSVKVGSATRGESTVALYTSPPPKRPWVGLEKEDMPDGKDPMFDQPYFIAGMVYAHNKLLEKNK